MTQSNQHLEQQLLLPEGAAPTVSPEEVCQQVVFLLELVLTSHKLERNWRILSQCVAINHLAVMRNWLPAGAILQEDTYQEGCLDFADRIRSARSEGINTEVRDRGYLLPALEQVNAVAAQFPRSTLIEAGLVSPEAAVLIEAYTCAATALVLGIDAPEIWPIPKHLWKNVQGLKEFTL